MKKLLASFFLSALVACAQTKPINNLVIQNGGVPISGIVYANGSSPATSISSSDPFQIGELGVGGAVSTGLIQQWFQATTGPGTITVSASSGSVSGSGTAFTLTFRVGDTITANTETHTISAIASDTSMTTDNWTGSASSVSYTLTGGSRAGLAGAGTLYLGAFPLFSEGSVFALVSDRTLTDIGTPSVRDYSIIGADEVSKTASTFSGAWVEISGQPHIHPSNIQNWTGSTNGGGMVGGYFVPTIDSGASGTVTAMSGLYSRIKLGSSGTLTKGYGFWVDNPTTGGATLTNAIGGAIDDQTSGTNNTNLLIGTLTPPSGNFAIYTAGSKNSSINNLIIQNGASNVTGIIAANGSSPANSISIGSSLNFSANMLSVNSTQTLNHIIAGGSAPGIAAGTGAGTSPTVSITGGDLSGYISVTTGTLPTLSATIVTITFNSAYASAPRCILIDPANSNSALLSGATEVFVDQAGITTTTFAITAGTSALTAATTYKWYYAVIQ